MHELGDYDHHHHAGNHGDVWKHCALSVWLGALLGEAPGPLIYLETHAGAGRYRLARAGEWRDGIARLLDGAEGGPPRAEAPPAVEAFLRHFAKVGIWNELGRVYPGSPNLAQHLLRPEDRLVLCELAPPALAYLREKLGGDPRVSVREEDGPTRLPALLAELAGAPGRPVVVVDPPYSQKDEWRVAGRALAHALAARPDAALFLWYPIISRTRPNALLAELGRAGVHGVALELVVTPLSLHRQALNGSGVLLVHAPSRAVAEIAAAGPWLGQALSTHAAWEARQVSF
jgi:23S rRNA (adenine2030-N6)-methyltransferase